MTVSGDWTMEKVRHLPPVLDLLEAAQLLRIGRSSAYALAKQNAFPAPVTRVGKQYRVATAGLLEVLGLADLVRSTVLSPDQVDDRHRFAVTGCANDTSRASISPTC